MTTAQTLEDKLDALIGGQCQPHESERILREAVSDDHSCQRVKAHLEWRHDLRAAFGYDHAADQIAQQLPHVHEEARYTASRTGLKQHSWRISPRAWNVAAGIAVVVSLSVAWLAFENQTQPVQTSTTKDQVDTPPSLKLTSDEAHRFRLLWSQVSNGVKPWVLVNGGTGEFGSLATRKSSPKPSAGVVVARWRVETTDKATVHQASLLLPRGYAVSIDLGRDETTLNRSVSLSLDTGDGLRAGYWLESGHQSRLGVGSQIAASDAPQRLGTFTLNNDTHVVYLRIQSLSHGDTAI